MSIAAAIDATALKVAAITGIKGAYGSQASDSTVSPMVESIPDTPVAIVALAEGNVSPGNWQRLDYGIDVFVYADRTDLGAAYKTLAAFPDLFITAWKTDRDLGGTVTESSLVAWSRPEPVNVSGKDLLHIIFHTRVIEAAGASYGV
jgi:hypothetical protein